MSENVQNYDYGQRPPPPHNNQNQQIPAGNCNNEGYDEPYAQGSQGYPERGYRGNGRHNYQHAQQGYGQQRGHGQQQGYYSSESYRGNGGSNYQRRQQSEGFGFRQQRSRDGDPMLSLSKSLSYLLRHGAERQKLKLLPGGFLYVDDILKMQQFRGATVQDVEMIVANNDKKRFALQVDTENRRLMIRANQGHTIEVENLELKRITDAKEIPVVIHGTYLEPWELIKLQGLKRFDRNHIHFAAGQPGEDGVISGMRKSCQVMIYINAEKAIADGIPFFVSANNVILSPGDKDGVIGPCYFEAAVNKYPYSKLEFDPDVDYKSSKKYKDEKDSSSKKGKGKKSERAAARGEGEKGKGGKDKTPDKDDDKAVTKLEEEEDAGVSQSSETESKKETTPSSQVKQQQSPNKETTTSSQVKQQSPNKETTASSQVKQQQSPNKETTASSQVKQQQSPNKTKKSGKQKDNKKQKDTSNKELEIEEFSLPVWTVSSENSNASQSSEQNIANEKGKNQQQKDAPRVESSQGKKKSKKKRQADPSDNETEKSNKDENVKESSEKKSGDQNPNEASIDDEVPSAVQDEGEEEDQDEGVEGDEGAEDLKDSAETEAGEPSGAVSTHDGTPAKKKKKKKKKKKNKSDETD